MDNFRQLVALIRAGKYLDAAALALKVFGPFLADWILNKAKQEVARKEGKVFGVAGPLATLTVPELADRLEAATFVGSSTDANVSGFLLPLTPVLVELMARLFRLIADSE